MRSDHEGLIRAALLAVLGAGLGVTLASDRQSVATARYVVDPTWPQKPNNLTWGQMPGITLDDHDQVVLKLSLQGKVLERVPLTKTATAPGKPGEVDWVHGIAVDAQGNLYLGDIQGHRAQKFLRRPQSRLYGQGNCLSPVPSATK